MNLKPVYLLITILFGLIVSEWISRIYISWEEILTQNRKNKYNWDIGYNRLLKEDGDIGHFLLSDSTIVLQNEEFTNTLSFVDIGIDSLMFRDDGINKTDVSILAVGDSFVWGWGVELNQTISELIESTMGIDVINAGMPGFGPQQYTRVMKRFLDNGVKADIVLYFFYSGNDMTDESKFRFWHNIKLKNVPDLGFMTYMRSRVVSHNAIQNEIKRRDLLSRNTPNNLMRQILMDWFALYEIGNRVYPLVDDLFFHRSRNIKPKDSIENSQQGGFIFSGNVKIKKGEGTVEIHPHLLNAVSCENVINYIYNANAECKINMPYLIDSIVEAKSICDLNGQELVFVYLPSKSEVYINELINIYPENEEKITSNMLTLHSKVTSIIDSLGIKLYDLSIPLKHDDISEPLYFRIDSHWNEVGHKVGAEYIIKSLRKDFVIN